MAGVRKKPLSCGKYQGWYRDHRGARVFFTGTRKQLKTRRIAEHLEDEHIQIRLGYKKVKTSAAKYAKRSFREVADEYLAWGNSQGGRGGRPWGKTHARERKSKLAWWEECLGLEVLGDLEGILPRVEAALRELQEVGHSGNGPGLSGKSIANYAESLKSFCNWAIQRSYLDTDPLTNIASFDTTPESRRRALAPEEIRKVIEVAPEDRRILYEIAFMTGLRAGELRALTLENLDVKRNVLILNPAWTKNRKPGLQPIPRKLVERLLEYGESGKAKDLYERHYGRKDAQMEGIPENPLLFVPTHTARDFKKDLKAAGVAVDISGEGKLDFHSLRVSFITFIVDAGASVKEGQTLARHATPDLTMNVYARTNDERLAAIVEKVGNTVLPESECALCVHQEGNGTQHDFSKYVTGIVLDADGKWWRRRDSNPRPRTGTCRLYMFSPD